MANGNCRQKKKNEQNLLHFSFTAYNLLDKPQAQYRKLKVIRFACLMLRKVDPRAPMPLMKFGLRLFLSLPHTP